MVKISELIDELNLIMKEQGDLPVYISHEWTEELTHVEFAEKHESKIFRDDKFPDRVDLW